MAFFDTTFYCNAGDQSTTGYYAVAKRAPSTAVTAGTIRRQFTAPSVNNERCFVCIIAGTTSASADATWSTSRGAKTTDGTVTWQECTGAAAVNGDATNTLTWAQVKAFAVYVDTGVIIKRNSGASYHICSTMSFVALGASEPAFSDTAGTTVNDNGAIWTSLGPVGSFTGGMAPFARLAAACTAGWLVAGGTVFVGNNHAESQATAISISPPVGMSKILCHNSAGSYPPTSSDLTTGATISTTAVAAITLSGGAAYFYGLTFKVALGAVTSLANLTVAPSTGGFISLESCSFWLAGGATPNTGAIRIGNDASGYSTVFWDNCTVKFYSVNNCVALGTVQFVWRNTGPVLAVGSAMPLIFLQPAAASNATLSMAVLEALDLSQITGSFNGHSVTTDTGAIVVRDCKLNAAMPIMQPTSVGQFVQLTRSSA
jgi:hypothetical protein